MITTAQFNDLVKNAFVQWMEGRKELASVRGMLANIKGVSEKTSEHSSLSQLPTARRRNEGDDAYKGNPKQGYSVTMTQQEIALGVDVTKQMRMFDKYDEIMRRVRGMGKSAERRMEMDVAAYLSYAWSTSFTNIDGESISVAGPDGLAMISASHTVNGSSSTFSNQIATTHSPISDSVLQGLEELFNGFLDDDGRTVPVTPNTIITGTHAPTKHAVQKILRSIQESGTTDNDINTFKGSYNHLVVPFLDFNLATEARDSNKARYVFLAALNPTENGLLIEKSQDISFEPPEQVFESGTWEFQTNALYDTGLL